MNFSFVSFFQTFASTLLNKALVAETLIVVNVGKGYGCLCTFNFDFKESLALNSQFSLRYQISITRKFWQSCTLENFAEVICF